VLEALPSVGVRSNGVFRSSRTASHSQIPHGRRKDWILAELDEEQKRKIGEHQITIAGTFLSPRVWASRFHPIYGLDRHLFLKLLDAAGSKGSFQPLLQHGSRVARPHTASSWAGEHGTESPATPIELWSVVTTRRFPL